MRVPADILELANCNPKTGMYGTNKDLFCYVSCATYNQKTFSCSKSKIETLEKCAKCIQSS